jgi:hypothetical protein
MGEMGLEMREAVMRIVARGERMRDEEEQVEDGRSLQSSTSAQWVCVVKQQAWALGALQGWGTWTPGRQNARTTALTFKVLAGVSGCQDARRRIPATA